MKALEQIIQEVRNNISQTPQNVAHLTWEDVRHLDKELLSDIYSYDTKHPFILKKLEESTKCDNMSMQNQAIEEYFNRNNKSTIQNHNITSNRLTQSNDPIEIAIKQLRDRLLDLTMRNKLLNFDPNKGYSLVIVGNLDVDDIFSEINQNKLNIQDLPTTENPNESKQNRANIFNIDIAENFKYPYKKISPHGLQTTLSINELESKLRKIQNKAKTHLEETGLNTLFLILGFLEYPEIGTVSNDKTPPLTKLAPLISIPIYLERGSLQNGVQKFYIERTSEEITNNQTLNYYMKDNFGIDLPIYEETEYQKLENFFADVEAEIEDKLGVNSNFKVRMRASIGFLSFGKYTMWQDLDVKQNPNILNNKTLKTLFGNSTEAQENFDIEDSDIEEGKYSNIEKSLIYDADSSQHKAIITALQDKQNGLVIYGPPGTGKSQTITNIIASALAENKKVLFVSEKLAALQVVSKRLNSVGLGPFLLELHSHKSDKSSFIKNIKDRIEIGNNKYNIIEESIYEQKLAELNSKRKELANYINLISQKNNNCGLNFQELVGKLEKLKKYINCEDTIELLKGISVPSSLKLNSNDNIEHIENFADVFKKINYDNNDFPWIGFEPNLSKTNISDKIVEIIDEAAEEIDSICSIFENIPKEYQKEIGENIDDLTIINNELNKIIKEHKNTKTDLMDVFLHKLNNENNEINDVNNFLSQKKNEIEKNYSNTEEIKIENLGISIAKLQQLYNDLIKENLNGDLNAKDLLDETKNLQLKILGILKSIEEKEYITKDSIDLDIKYKNFKDFYLNSKVLNNISISKLTEDIKKVESIYEETKKYLEELKKLLDKHKIKQEISLGYCFSLDDKNKYGLNENVQLDEIKKQIENFNSRDELNKFLQNKEKKYLLDLNDQYGIEDLESSYNQIESYIKLFGLDSNDNNFSILNTVNFLIKIFKEIPIELLDFRLETLSEINIELLIDELEKDLFEYRTLKEKYESIFYQGFKLSQNDISTHIPNSINSFRTNTGFFSFLNKDWRNAKKFYKSIAKNSNIKDPLVWASNLELILNLKEKFDYINNDISYKKISSKPLIVDIKKIRETVNWYKKSKIEKGNFSNINKNYLSIMTNLTKEHIDTIKYDNTIQKQIENLQKYEQQLKTIIKENKIHYNIPSNYNEKNKILIDFYSNVKNIGLFLNQNVEQDFGLIYLNNLINFLLELENNPKILGNEHISTLRENIKYVTSLNLTLDNDDNLVEWMNELSHKIKILTQLKTCSLEITDNQQQNLYSIFENSSLRENIEEYLSKYKITINTSQKDFEYFSNIKNKTIYIEKLISDILSLFQNSKAILIKDYLESIYNNIKAQNTFNEINDYLSKNCINLNINTTEKLQESLNISDWLCKINNLKLDLSIKKAIAKMEIDAITSLKIKINKAINHYAQWKLKINDIEKHEYGNISNWIISERDIDLLSEKIGRLEIQDLNNWIQYKTKRMEANKIGLEKFITEIENKKIPIEKINESFAFSYYYGICKSLFENFSLNEYNSEKLNRWRKDFSELDKEIIKLQSSRISSNLIKKANPPRGVLGQKASDLREMALLKHETTKSKRILPFRQLINKAKKSILELKPCFMMSPLSVANYLDQDIGFDLIIMDEASQIKPEDAIGSILRGTKVIVVGDPKQLPPTSFFNTISEDEEEDEIISTIEGKESILSLCEDFFPTHKLNWHYRSRHQSLIDFSNHHFYNNSLVIFPSPYDKHKDYGVEHIYIKNGEYEQNKRINMPEADTIIKYVEKHITETPNLSLGIVTMNSAQCEHIEDLLFELFKNPIYLEYKSKHENKEPFFVKNLENVQGDERDVIFISTTYGPDKITRKIKQNFGPINHSDGWRRLNVLFTRAKNKIKLFTSMTSDDVIEVEKETGKNYLKYYLKYSENGGIIDYTNVITDRSPDSPFEISVAEKIKSMGYQVQPQLGVAGFFIDIAVKHPTKKDVYLAAIECDGATYHSSKVARDRDRLRQEILENLGWKGKIYRIWSTDWFRDSNGEIEKLKWWLDTLVKVEQ